LSNMPLLGREYPNAPPVRLGAANDGGAVCEADPFATLPKLYCSRVVVPQGAASVTMVAYTDWSVSVTTTL
jgi:hypothetical protein